MEFSGPSNQSIFERFLRVILGLGLLALSSETALGYLGFIPLVSGAAGVCPLYGLLGINSCSAGGCEEKASN